MSVTPEIYLDNASTSRPWPEVIEASARAMADGFGNASSLHRRGLAAARLVADAERAIVDLVGGGDWSVFFTSGGSEADALAVLGSVPRGRRDAVVTTSIDHAAVREAGKRLAERGAAWEEISAGVSGVVDPGAIALAVTEKTALVSISHVANEMGTVQRVSEIASRVKARFPKCRIHVDAVQAAAQLPRLDYPREVDLVTISGHKLHGPQGIGALLARPDALPKPLLTGGDQQGGVRPGTLNLPGIAGFAIAARLVAQRRKVDVPQMAALTTRLAEGAFAVPGVRALGDPASRAPGMAVLAVVGVRSEVLLHALESRGVLASSGSACHSRRAEPPKCLRDAGLARDEGAVRFSLGFDTTREEVELAVRAFSDAVAAVRSSSAGG